MFLNIMLILVIYLIGAGLITIYYIIEDDLYHNQHKVAQWPWLLLKLFAGVILYMVYGFGEYLLDIWAEFKKNNQI